MQSFVDGVLDRVRDAADALGLPITVVKTTPDPEQTFWMNLIGRGYPAPYRAFRWCTDRMKIRPTSTYIKERVVSSGEVILLLGVRKAESVTRARSIEKHGSDRLNPHGQLNGCWVFRPIVKFTTEEVWQTLLQRCRRMLSAIERGPRRLSAPSDLARWKIFDCGDFKPLSDAIETAMPKAELTREIINGAIECMVVAYYNGSTECDECKEASRAATS